MSGTRLTDDDDRVAGRADTAPLQRDATRPVPSDPAPDPAPRRGGIGRWLLWIGIAALTLVLLALLLLGRLVSGFDPFNRATVDRTQPPVLLALQDLSQYRAATGEFQVVVDTEETVRNLPRQIAGERTLFVATGTVDAAVDFAGLDEDAVTVDDARERVTVRLPHAELTEAYVDPDRSYVFSRDRGLLDRLAGVFSDEPTSERPLYRRAERRMARAATDSGLVELAERNTEAMLRSLLTSLGFTDITVTFR